MSENVSNINNQEKSNILSVKPIAVEELGDIIYPDLDNCKEFDKNNEYENSQRNRIKIFYDVNSDKIIPTKNTSNKIFLSETIINICNDNIKEIKIYKSYLSPNNKINNYVNNHNTFFLFVKNCCEFHNDNKLGIAGHDLYNRYVVWCDDNGFNPIKFLLFIDLSDNIFQRYRCKNKWYYINLTLI